MSFVLVGAKKFRSFVYLCDIIRQTNHFIYLFFLLLQYFYSGEEVDVDQPILMWIKKRRKSGDELGEFVLVFRWLCARA